MSIMDLSVGFTTSTSIEMVEWIARNADSLDLYGVWVGEDIGRPQDIFTVTSLILLETKRVNVGIGVVSPFIRNITTLARAAAALEEISPGRFRLGLGVGGLQDLASMGVKVERPVESMRKIVEALREIWKGQGRISGKEIALDHYRPQPSRIDVPIFMGVRGPKLVSLAAEIADGLILSGPRQYVKEMIRLVRERRSTAGLAENDFSFVLWVPTIMLSDDRDLELAKRVVAVVAADTPDSLLEEAGASKEEVEEIRTVMRRGGVKEAAKLVSEKLVYEFCVSGDAERICEYLRSYSSLGVDEVIFGPPYGRDPREAIQRVAKAWGGPDADRTQPKR
ncbi:LLM class flavin-dependent oxidoreductase [Candidatus Bathyarchaeota archaeon]|nr:LLM class flavin-dependent oxidoreductase [Candidatus Bathyarchaeota archaeon]